MYLSVLARPCTVGLLSRASRSAPGGLAAGGPIGTPGGRKGAMPKWPGPGMAICILCAGCIGWTGPPVVACMSTVLFTARLHLSARLFTKQKVGNAPLEGVLPQFGNIGMHDAQQSLVHICSLPLLVLLHRQLRPGESMTAKAGEA